MDWDSVEVPAALMVNGYDMRGTVLSEGSPVLNVQVLLFSDAKGDAQVACDAAGRAAAAPHGALCSTVTDADGVFAFPSCPCGCAPSSRG
eukprot:2323160-Pyramimonas_sp.AAC.1